MLRAHEPFLSKERTASCSRKNNQDTTNCVHFSAQLASISWFVQNAAISKPTKKDWVLRYKGCVQPLPGHPMPLHVF